MRRFSQFSLPITLVASSALALVLLPALQPKAPLAFVTSECMALMQQMRSLAPDSNGFEALGDQMKQVCMPSMTDQNATQNIPGSVPENPVSSCPDTTGDIAACKSENGTFTLVKDAEGCRRVQCIRPAPTAQSSATKTGDPHPRSQRIPSPVPESAAAKQLICTRQTVGESVVLSCEDGSLWHPSGDKKAKKIPAATPRNRTKKPSTPQPSSTADGVAPAACADAEAIQQAIKACQQANGWYVVNTDKKGCDSVACLKDAKSSGGTWCLDDQGVDSQGDVDKRHATCKQVGGIGSFNQNKPQCAKYYCSTAKKYGQNQCTLFMDFSFGEDPCWQLTCNDGFSPSSMEVCDLPAAEFNTFLPCKTDPADANGCIVTKCADGTTSTKCPASLADNFAFCPNVDAVVQSIKTCQTGFMGTKSGNIYIVNPGENGCEVQCWDKPKYSCDGSEKAKNQFALDQKHEACLQQGGTGKLSGETYCPTYTCTQ